MMFEKQRSEAAATKEMRKIAMELDASKSGRISREELMKMSEDRRIRRLFQLFDIEIADVDLFYEMLTDIIGNNELDIELFVAACMKMKGHASSADVQLLIYQSKAMHSSIAALAQ